MSQTDTVANVSQLVYMHTQALTLENYEEIQFNLQRDTNFGALIFILAWVVFGYYILLVLFMAIILEAFESKYDKGAIQEAYLACKLHQACETSCSVCIPDPVALSLYLLYWLGMLTAAASLTSSPVAAHA